ncbi:MAG TPA: Ig-like domain-containing protein [Anaerolineaceae bacterium]|nr:Ig-like domain-containing protein [Anaerolineaceae bacterium]
MKNRFVRRVVLSIAILFLCAFQTFTSPSMVQAANHAPVALNHAYSLRENATLSKKMQATDQDHNPLTYSVVSGPSNGQLKVTNPANGSFTYTPNPYWHGTDSFRFKANDGQLDSNTATVTFTVTAVNYSPVAVNDSYTTNEDVALVVPVESGVLKNDTDPDPEDTLTAVLVTRPVHGVLVFNSNGSLTYTPTLNWNGTDSFTYRSRDGKVSSKTATVSIVVVSVNDPPVAVNDVYLTTEDTPLVVSAASGVLKNDSDVDTGDTALLSASLVAGPSQGVLNLMPDGGFTYTPNSNWNGADQFTYRASDGKADSNIATVILSISLVNDPPVAQDLSFTLDEDNSLTNSLVASDPDQDSLHYSLASSPAHGQISLEASTGSFTYTPDQNWNGVDSFTCIANDGLLDSNLATVTLTVQPVNDPPVADDQSLSVNEDAILTDSLVAVDVEGDSLTFSAVTGPAHGSLTVSPNGSFSYTPAVDYNGTDSFTFRANDGAADSNTAAISIAIAPVNDAPVAQDMAISTAENTSTSSMLNASDVDGDTLSFAMVVSPLHGDLVMDPDIGSFTYTPAPDWYGQDSFTFKANDGEVDSGNATVAITVNHVNHAPTIASIGSRQVDELTLLSFAVNASDPDVGDALTFSLGPGAPDGAAVDLKTGEFTWTPGEAQGPGEFDVTVIVTDSGSPAQQDSATFKIQVGEVNSAPVLGVIGVKTVEKWPFTFTALATDGDLPANRLTFSLDSGAPAGALIDPDTGVFLWNPTSMVSAGVYHVTVRVTDAAGLSDSETISIVVLPGIPISGGSVIYLPLINR